MRLDAYAARKTHLLEKLGEEADRCANKARFISAVIARELVIGNRPRAAVLAELHDGGYKGFDPKDGEDAGAVEDLGVGSAGADVNEAVLGRRYSYLLSLRACTALRARAHARARQLTHLSSITLPKQRCGV